MKLKLIIETNGNKIYNDQGNHIGEQRGKQCKLVPFENGEFIPVSFPEGFKLDADSWLIEFESYLDEAHKEEYYECYRGIYVLPYNNDMKIYRCSIFLFDEVYKQLENSDKLIVSLEYEE